MTSRHGAPLPDDLTGVFRELVNAHAKALMYPQGHRLSKESAEKFATVLGEALEARGSITLGFTPRTILIDGTAVEPLPGAFRQFGAKLHKRSVGTVHFVPGVTTAEIGDMLQALADGDAEDRLGREGLMLPHIRIEPLVYDVLAFGEAATDQDLDEVFWSRLVEAALGYRVAAGDPQPSTAEIAAAINERAPQSADHAKRIYEALAAFASALASRGESKRGGARRRFTEILSALSRPATTAVLASVPSKTSRRRFMRETIEQVPATLILQVLDSVAEADGDPLSDHLRWLLGKLAGQELGNASDREGDFATQVLGLMEQWDGAEPEIFGSSDARLLVEPPRMIGLGLELDLPAPAVLKAAVSWSSDGHLADVIQLIDLADPSGSVPAAISAEILSLSLLERMLSDQSPDWALVERVVMHQGVAAVEPLLTALDQAKHRTLRRRMIDQLVKVGPEAEPILIARLSGAPWYLARNILAVLSQLPKVDDLDAVMPLLRHEDPRVRLEALKALLRYPATRIRATIEALESDEAQMVRTAMASLGGECPPEVVAPLLSVLADEDDDMVMQAIKLVGESDNPLVVGPLLGLVRERGGLFRRWRLAPKTPVMMSALGILVRRWPNHRPVLLAMQIAARSSDPEVHRVIGLNR